MLAWATMWGHDGAAPPALQAGIHDGFLKGVAGCVLTTLYILLGTPGIMRIRKFIQLFHLNISGLISL